MAKSIKIVIADDHEIFRDGFKLLLNNQKELELVGEAENGKQLLKVVEETHPDVVFIDIQMPIMDGLEACRLIKQNFEWIRIIALTMFNEDHMIVDMLESGARGYLLKNTNKNELLLATKTVFRGDTYYCLATSGRLAKLIAESNYSPQRQKTIIRFTPRELEVMELICRQFSNKEIAKQLDIGQRTVESYREKIQEKTGAKNVIGIVIYALKNDLVKL
jgi:DNA-binding NarL/FixJ family response regulator